MTTCITIKTTSLKILEHLKCILKGVCEFFPGLNRWYANCLTLTSQLTIIIVFVTECSTSVLVAKKLHLYLSIFVTVLVANEVLEHFLGSRGMVRIAVMIHISPPPTSLSHTLSTLFGPSPYNSHGFRNELGWRDDETHRCGHTSESSMVSARIHLATTVVLFKTLTVLVIDRRPTQLDSLLSDKTTEVYQASVFLYQDPYQSHLVACSEQIMNDVLPRVSNSTDLTGECQSYEEWLAVLHSMLNRLHYFCHSFCI